MTSASGTTWGTSPSSTVQEISQPDGRIHGLWLLGALASYLIWTGFLVVLWIGSASGSGSSDLGIVPGLLGVSGLLASGFTSYLVYALVDRCNKHFARTELLYWASLERLEAGSARSDLWIPLRSAQESVSKLIRVEHQRSAVLWALLCMIPIIGSVFLVAILWLTSRGFRQHSLLEGPVIEDMDRTLRTSGSTGITAGTVLLLSRDILGYVMITALVGETIVSALIGFSAYLVLAYLTIGGLSLLWLDLAINDPLPHFRNHPRLEGGLMRLVSSEDLTTRGPA